MANEKNTAVKGYKINFANNTITVNYTFKKASEEYGTAEYELLKNILADFPTMTIIVKSGREKKTASKFKNLTYEKMRTYISVLDNADEMNAVMDTIEHSQNPRKALITLYITGLLHSFLITTKFRH